MNLFGKVKPAAQSPFIFYISVKSLVGKDILNNFGILNLILSGSNLKINSKKTGICQNSLSEAWRQLTVLPNSFLRREYIK
jgi:hypothetical protein